MILEQLADRGRARRLRGRPPFQHHQGRTVWRGTAVAIRERARRPPAACLSEGPRPRARGRGAITQRATSVAGASAGPCPSTTGHDLSVEVGGEYAACRRLEPFVGAVDNQLADAFRIERIVRCAKQRQHVLRPFEPALEHALAAPQAPPDPDGENRRNSFNSLNISRPVGVCYDFLFLEECHDDHARPDAAHKGWLK